MRCVYVWGIFESANYRQDSTMLFLHLHLPISITSTSPNRLVHSAPVPAPAALQLRSHSLPHSPQDSHIQNTPPAPSALSPLPTQNLPCHTPAHPVAAASAAAEAAADSAVQQLACPEVELRSGTGNMLGSAAFAASDVADAGAVAGAVAVAVARVDADVGAAEERYGVVGLQLAIAVLRTAWEAESKAGH